MSSSSWPAFAERAPRIWNTTPDAPAVLGHVGCAAAPRSRQAREAPAAPGLILKGLQRVPSARDDVHERLSLAFPGDDRAVGEGQERRKPAGTEYAGLATVAQQRHTRLGAPRDVPVCACKADHRVAAFSAGS